MMSPRPPATAATPLSGVVAASGPAIQWYSLLSGLMRTSWTLARTSLALAIAMSSSACLVLSPPEYDKPEQTAPTLVASAAFPDLRQTIYVFDDTPFVEFGGAVLSEDAGDQVQLAIYLDYGQRNAADRPYRNVVYPFEPIPPGTLADGPRTFLPKRWYPSVHAVLNGCHTATLMASHGFDADVCPTSATDSSFLVWQVIRCTSSIDCNDQCEPPTCDAAQGCASCGSPSPDAGAAGGTP